MSKKKKENAVLMARSEIEHDLFQKTFEPNDMAALDMLMFLSEVEENQKWLLLSLDKLNAVVESGGALIIPSLKQNYKFYEGVTDEAIKSTIENGRDISNVAGSQFFIETCELENRKVTIPISSTGLNSLVMRSGTDCSAISRASLLDKQVIINIGLKTLKGKQTLCLVSYGKVRAFNGGGTYAVLKESVMFDGILKYLKNTYKKSKFMGGTYTHDYTTASFELTSDSEKILKSYSEACSEIGVEDVDDFKVWMYFSTSEVGASCATVSVALVKGLMKIVLGSPIKIEHSGDNHAEDFVAMLPTLMAKTKELMQSLKSIMEIKVQYPINAIIALGKFVGLSKIATLTVATDMQTRMDEDLKMAKEENKKAPTYTAHDVFFHCQEALMLMRKNNVAPATIEKCEENLSRCLVKGFIWADFDKELRPEWNNG